MDETRWLTWNPQFSCSGSLTFTSVTTQFAKYKIGNAELKWETRCVGTLGGTASTDIYITVPFESLQMTNTFAPVVGAGNTNAVAAKIFVNAGTPDKITFQRYDAGNYPTSGSNIILGFGFYEI